MRKVYIVDHDLPATAEDIAAAEGIGANEVICGIPEALAALGIDTFGYHEVVEPTPAIEPVTMRQAQLALHAAGLWGTVKARAAANDEFDIWLRASQTVERQNDVLLAAATDMGLSSDQVDALFASARTFP